MNEIRVLSQSLKCIAKYIERECMEKISLLGYDSSRFQNINSEDQLCQLPAKVMKLKCLICNHRLQLYIRFKEIAKIRTRQGDNETTKRRRRSCSAGDETFQRRPRTVLEHR